MVELMLLIIQKVTRRNRMKRSLLEKEICAVIFATYKKTMALVNFSESSNETESSIGDLFVFQ
jgi:hypothetical protein